MSDLESLDNVWYWGPPGTGKSHTARTKYPDNYDKPLNKWWDDYKHQPTVILDDFGKDHSMLVSHLKRWADKYAFTAETKGGATRLRPRRIVVTSNYHPDQIFQEKVDQEAIERRFNIVHMTEPYVPDD